MSFALHTVFALELDGEKQKLEQVGETFPQIYRIIPDLGNDTKKSDKDWGKEGSRVFRPDASISYLPLTCLFF